MFLFFNPVYLSEKNRDFSIGKVRRLKLLRKIISLILVFILGFWFAFAGILDGTKAGDVLITIVSYLPDRNDIHNILDEPTEEQSRQIDSDSEEVTEPTTLQVDFESEDNEVNYELVEATIIELTNELRQEQGLSTLVPNDMLRAAAYIRAEELEETFSHTRPNGSDAFTVFQEEGISYPYHMVGENLAMGTYYLREAEMAQFLFDGWVESEGHYENMIRQEYAEIGVGVHYDGEILYATQMFGTQR